MEFWNCQQRQPASWLTLFVSFHLALALANMLHSCLSQRLRWFDKAQHWVAGVLHGQCSAKCGEVQCNKETSPLPHNTMVWNPDFNLESCWIRAASRNWTLLPRTLVGKRATFDGQIEAVEGNLIVYRPTKPALAAWHWTWRTRHRKVCSHFQACSSAYQQLLSTGKSTKGLQLLTFIAFQATHCRRSDLSGGEWTCQLSLMAASGGSHVGCPVSDDTDLSTKFERVQARRTKLHQNLSESRSTTTYGLCSLWCLWLLDLQRFCQEFLTRESTLCTTPPTLSETLDPLLCRVDLHCHAYQQHGINSWRRNQVLLGKWTESEHCQIFSREKRPRDTLGLSIQMKFFRVCDGRNWSMIPTQVGHYVFYLHIMFPCQPHNAHLH